MGSDNGIERILLVGSMGGALLFALIGIGWGFAVHSQIILFDGLYSLVSLVLSFISLFALRMIKEGDTQQFQFGKQSIEPLVVIFKSVILLIMSIFAIVTAISELVNGGRVVELGPATAYAFLSTIICGSIYLYLQKRQQDAPSALVKAEVAEWYVDSILSLAVLVGLGIAYGLSMSPWSHLTNYVDSILVILIAGCLLQVPVRIMIPNMRELLMMAPHKDIQRYVDRAVKGIQQEYCMENSYTRVTKVGRKVIIEIDYVLGKESTVKHVQQCDMIRERLDGSLDTIKYEKWLTVSFTEDNKWAV